MNEVEIQFEKQLDGGATDQFIYGIETLAETLADSTVEIKIHKGTLDSFPDNLEFVRMMSDATPLFKEI
jgi:hypothetical protein